MKHYKTRIELTCGQNETCPERMKTYQIAWEIAKKHQVPTFFDSSIQSSDTYMDGYLYPCSNQVEKVLTDLETNNVGFDNVDLPPELKHNILTKRLEKRFPHRFGVEINTDWRTEKCETIENPQEPFSLWNED